MLASPTWLVFHFTHIHCFSQLETTIHSMVKPIDHCTNSKASLKREKAFLEDCSHALVWVWERKTNPEMIWVHESSPALLALEATLPHNCWFLACYGELHGQTDIIQLGTINYPCENGCVQQDECEKPACIAPGLMAMCDTCWLLTDILPYIGTWQLSQLG